VRAPVSYWLDSLEPGDDLSPRPPLGGDAQVDVAVVGAGFTGLWTAYELLRADPSLRVVVLERDVAGFGASGRNGGWCVGDYGGPLGAVEKAHGTGASEAMARAMHGAVDVVAEVVERERIDCGWAKAGAIYVARNAGELAHLRIKCEQATRYGFGDAWSMLTAAETEAIVRMDGAIGSAFTPHAAALNPARLARGMARAIERSGGTVHEGTAVRAIDGRTVRTEHGDVRAEVVVRATEGYTASIEGHERAMVPLGNHMVATEPIDQATWDQIGLASRELFELSWNLLGYGQRTHDGRIAWGGLGAFYKWGSKVPPTPTLDPRMRARLQRVLVELFPPLRGIGFTHHWGGVMGVPRDLLPRVGYDKATGLAFGGGYTGQGVAAANVAGRTLADLIRGVDSDVARLPWAGPPSRDWETEPFRWLGIHAFASLAGARDRIDQRRG
jgi:glycine/D-amino acid oxidase-like deaminating enzyme